MHRILALSLAGLAAFTSACGDDTSGSGGAGGAGTTSADASTATGATSATGSSSNASGSTASSSASTATVGSSTASGGATTCGEEPYVDVHLVVRSYITEGLVEGATLTVNLCPGLSLTSNAEGELDAAVGRDQAFQARLEATNHLTMRLGEQLLVEPFDAEVPLFPTLATAILPDWGEDRPSLMVLMDNHEDELEEGDPCGLSDGWEVVVNDHDEAIVTYYSGESTPNPDPELTATGPLGLAAFEGLADTEGDANIEITATKDGCDDVTFVSYPFTGGHALENGVLTVAVGRVPALPTP
jgi:hypothetical protein